MNTSALIKENKDLKAQLIKIKKDSKKNKSTTCVDCGSSKGKPRSFSFGSAGSYRAIQCDVCWKESLYEMLD